MIYEPVILRSSWDFHATPAYYFGLALNHYRCFTVFLTKTRTPRTSDTVEFLHNFITVPHVTPEDRVINAITKIKQELAAVPSPNSSHQLTAIKELKSVFSKCKEKESTINNNVNASDTINDTSTDS